MARVLAENKIYSYNNKKSLTTAGYEKIRSYYNIRIYYYSNGGGSVKEIGEIIADSMKKLGIVYEWDGDPNKTIQAWDSGDIKI